MNRGTQHPLPGLLPGAGSAGAAGVVPAAMGPGSVPPLWEQPRLRGAAFASGGTWWGSAVGSGQSHRRLLTRPPAPCRVTAPTRTAWASPGCRVPRASPGSEASRWVRSPSVPHAPLLRHPPRCPSPSRGPGLVPRCPSELERGQVPAVPAMVVSDTAISPQGSPGLRGPPGPPGPIVSTPARGGGLLGCAGNVS